MQSIAIGCKAHVLIDTWWNVNYVRMPSVGFSAISFNRYMVECELNSDRCRLYISYSFNRYMVECEYACCYSHSGIKSGFNRYMVECEFWSMTTDKAVIVVLIDT